MSAVTVRLTMDCPDCGVGYYQELATPEHPGRWDKRGRLQLPAAVTDHECSSPSSYNPGGTEVSRAEDWDRIRKEVESDPEALMSIIDELRALWLRCLDREQRLAGAVADVMWRAQPYGTVDDGTEEGDTFAYLVTKGAMHRLIGVAQQNGVGVSVAFNARPQPPEVSE